MPKRASHAKVRWTLHRIDTNADSNGALACQSLTSAFDALVELERPKATTEQVNTKHVDGVGDEAELDAAFEDDELETRRQRSLAAAKDVLKDVAGSEVAEEASGWIDANSNAIVERGEHYYRQVREREQSPPSPQTRCGAPSATNLCRCLQHIYASPSASSTSGEGATRQRFLGL